MLGLHAHCLLSDGVCILVGSSLFYPRILGCHQASVQYRGLQLSQELAPDFLTLVQNHLQDSGQQVQLFAPRLVDPQQTGYF